MRTAIATLLLASLAGGAAAEDSCPRSISVVGHASLAQPPDFVEIAVGIEVKGASPAAALDAASKAVAGISALAREAGVPPADIGTAAVSLRPVTRTVMRPGGGGATQEPDGYQANNIVRLRLSDMDRLGDILRRALDAGANRIDGITFGLRDPDAVMAGLQVNAAKDARARAASLAEAVGAKLGRVCTVTVQHDEPVGLPMRAVAAAAPKGRRVPVEAGTVDSSASVEVVFAIEP